MFTKRQFTELIKYLQDRPNELERLRALLTGENPDVLFQKSSSGESDSQWLTAREVGEKVGRKSRWVRDKIPLLPEYAVRLSTGKKPTWYINYPLVADMLQQIKTA